MPVYFSSLIPKMSMSTLAISSLTMSDIPWFMDLTFQVPMEDCSLQCQTWFSPPDTNRLFHFGPAISLLLELVVIALCSSPVIYWIPSNLGVLIFQYHFFFFSYYSWGSPGNNTEWGSHFLVQWPSFCQNASLWPIYVRDPAQHGSWLHRVMQAPLPQ